ncbi:T4S4 protein, partial [Passerina amoena]|nr:T4S4 protein [Passerina amoena]
MCTGGCAKCLGSTLIPLAVLCTLANILLFFPGGKVEESAHITDEVWYFGGILGSGVLMIFPALVFLGLQNNDCCGCCGNRSCGKRFAVSERKHGKKINIVFFLTVLFSCRDYLADHALWEKCTSPDNIVPWHLTLFSLLLVMSGIQGVLCGIQVVNGLFGTICGDCKCCGCCG